MRKIVADMYVRPAFRRWGVRFALAIGIAIAIGYVPSQVARRDPRAGRLEAQIDQLTAEGREVAARNAELRRQIAALRSDIAAVEDHARADLGMVYPDELVLRLPQTPEAPEARDAPEAPEAPEGPRAP
ncbi:MAG TPA: septum formation initiator family protein [Kofleriaceae bacterium]